MARGFPRKFRFYLLYFLSSLPVEFSRTKARLIRGLGGRVGTAVKFGARSYVLCRDYRSVEISDYVRIYPGVWIACESVVIGEDARIDFGVRVRGRRSLRVGHGCYIGADAYIDTNRDVVIEDEAGVGPGTWIFTHSVWHPVSQGGLRKFAPVRIKRGAWIPAGVFVMPGVVIGEEATVGARSVVVEDIPDRTFAVGSPAKVVREQPAQHYIGKDAMRTELVTMLQGFAEFAVTTGVCEDVENRIGPWGPELSAWRASWRGKQIHRIICMDMSRPSSEFIESMSEELSSGRTTVLALERIPAELEKELAAREIAWFDFERRLRSRGRAALNESFHDFLRGDYGIRFRRATAD